MVWCGVVWCGVVCVCVVVVAAVAVLFDGVVGCIYFGEFCFLF